MVGSHWPDDGGGEETGESFQPRCAASMCVGSHSVLVQCNIAAALVTAFIR